MLLGFGGESMLLTTFSCNTVSCTAGELDALAIADLSKTL
jgi:hypothetical protein